MQHLWARAVRLFRVLEPGVRRGMQGLHRVPGGTVSRRNLCGPAVLLRAVVLADLHPTDRGRILSGAEHDDRNISDGRPGHMLAHPYDEHGCTHDEHG